LENPGILKQAQLISTMNAIRITLFLAFTVFLIGGCALGKPDPDPLAGWKRTGSANKGNPYAKSIVDDYLKYVQGLSAKERKFVEDYNIWFYEDGNGRHAVKIFLSYDGTLWEHVLIYSPENRRIHAIKRFNGHYRS
jgi:hypothetical protein